MNSELSDILHEARALIARGDHLDADAFEARVRTTGGDAGVAQLHRVLAVARAKRSLAMPPVGPQAPTPRPRAAVYRARPTIAGTLAVRARAAGDAVALEWEPRREVVRWDARIAERADARAPYVDRETLTLDGPRLELRLAEHPQRVSITGRAASGRVVQHALVSGLTSANWTQQWQRRATAS